MPEYFGRQQELGLAERSFGGWRVIAAAWALAIVVVMLFSGVQALASRHAAEAQQTRLIGAMIPRHDPSCIPSGDLDEVLGPKCYAASGDDLAQARAEAAIGSSYGW